MHYDLHGVSVRHPFSAINGTYAVSGLTLSIRHGEQVALVGPSGAGKTTVLHTLACAHRPDAGSFSISGTDPWALTSAERHKLRTRQFLAPQTPPLPPRQRVVTAVLSGRLPHWSLWKAFVSLIKPAEPQAAYEALARFNLQDKLYARVDRLSGGERQRCGMARLLVSAAQAFLVDEPLSALDPALAAQTLIVLQQEAAARGATLVCSLHHVELARVHFPRLIGLRDGRIVFDAQREDVTDAMIEALYRNENTLVSDPLTGEREAVLASAADIARCF
jgi:phosphonate transport system ATP-binding protein